ncbi:MAG: molecular chaperone HtpG [Spirochaetales bacterium]|nr:molecular chaperone HtpG [Spirochaetales bacterium]
MAQKKFKTEVSQLLDLIVHSLYSHKEIFLRELVSNASDALDKLKYLTFTNEDYKKVEFDPRIDITFTDEKKRTLTLKDSGIGMNENELNEQLGTIARSGTKKFLNQMHDDAKKDANLIGQFGVGFYSCFMVSERVEVITRKAGDEKAWKWSSNGRNAYSVDEAERDTHGTTIILHLNDEGEEYANRWQVEQLVKKYSDHIAFPIFLEYDDKTWEGEGDDRKEKIEHKVEQINKAAALWKRSKSELSNEDYNEFYKTTTHDNEDPLFYIHTKAEGVIEYTTLFFIPSKAPFDLYQADYKPGVKLYVKRVYITDDEKELLPPYLRFVRGIIDSEDLPLNVSREILQQNRVMTNIRNGSVKKLLSEFKKISESNPDLYVKFVEQFNRPLKEGLYSDYANREALMELVRFKSTEVEGYTGLASYKERMKEDQKAIYFIAGGSEETLRNSPLIEAYKNKGIEVLVMDDDIDDIVIPTIGKYADVDLKAINKSSAADDLKTDNDKEKEKAAKPVAKKIKEALGERVKDVVVSSRLTESPSCIVVDENDPTVQMQQMLKAMGQTEMPEFTPILEINPDHVIVKKLGETKDKELIADISHILLDQAMLAEGVMIKHPAEFVKKLNAVLSRTL